MLKVVQRTAMAKSQARRRAAAAAKKKDLDTRRDTRANWVNLISRENTVIKNAKAAQREEWFLGPLAPRRDIGSKTHSWNTHHQLILHPPDVPSAKRKFSPGHFAEKDRVVITRGADRGRIGIVKTVDQEAQTVTVDSMNEANFMIPEPMLSLDPTAPRSGVQAIPLPMRSVLHVHRHQGRDVVVKDIEVFEAPKSRNYGTEVGTQTEPQPLRVVPGYEFPHSDGRDLPKDTEGLIPSHDNTTTYEQAPEAVTRQTFRPMLETTPMPKEVLDELRGKYSYFRTRHNEDFIQAKKEEAASAQTKDKAKTLAKKYGTRAIVQFAPDGRPVYRLRNQRDLRGRKLNTVKPTKAELAEIGQLMSRVRLRDDASPQT